MSGVARGGARFAKLDGKTVVPCSGGEWSAWFEKMGHGDGCQVALWEAEDKSVAVSTVFIGLNYGWVNDKDLWFETKIFVRSCATTPDVCAPRVPATVASFHGETRRYETWDEAERGHESTVGEVLAAAVAIEAEPHGCSKNRALCNGPRTPVKYEETCTCTCHDERKENS